MSKRKLTRQQRWRIEKIQAERAARAARRDHEEATRPTAGQVGVEREGRVIAHFGHTLDVRAAADGVVYRCHRRANLEGLVTGDRVVWRAADDGTGVVVARGARDNILQRPDNRGQLKPVAANLDQILIVFAVEPEPYPNLIDRYLVAAEATGIPPILVLNKCDLLSTQKSGSDLSHLLDGYHALGYPTIKASTAQSDGLDALYHQLAGKTSVFVGQSGVGKSSLIDRLLPGVSLRIGDLSGDARKGTHTTTTAQLYTLPEGGELIDSPGIRDFSLTHLDEQQVTEGFIEFRPFLGRCRFRDCRHRNEPGCALQAAVERGDIHPDRFDSYRRILNSLGIMT
ncbi:small ribosomal subunit biogenesis GTPase RsgA [Aidingimonas halophila]|nr:small ribosomal subunit biogenesis GTPase RsgA [Aidingimonas halophila]GHC19622.1 putative ribosome biogenesis GTPase RsgA [Aidingimonas halophila]